MEKIQIKGAVLLGPNELILELDGDLCIETTGRKVHRRLMNGLLDGTLSGEAVEGAVNILARFLATQDFAAIRGTDEELAGSYRARVRVFRGDSDQVGWEKLEA